MLVMPVPRRRKLVEPILYVLAVFMFCRAAASHQCLALPYRVSATSTAGLLILSGLGRMRRRCRTTPGRSQRGVHCLVPVSLSVIVVLLCGSWQTSSLLESLVIEGTVAKAATGPLTELGDCVVAPESPDGAQAIPPLGKPGEASRPEVTPRSGRPEGPVMKAVVAHSSGPAASGKLVATVAGVKNVLRWLNAALEAVGGFSQARDFLHSLCHGRYGTGSSPRGWV